MKVEQTISCPIIASLISSGLKKQKRFLDLMERLEEIYRSDHKVGSKLIEMRIDPVIDDLYDLTDGITDTRDECAERPRCRRCPIGYPIRNS